MDLSRLTLGERIILLCGVLLIIDLLFLPWHDVDVGVSIAGIDTTRSGVQSPNGFYGIIALLMAIVMVGQLIAAKIAGATLPDPPVPWSQVHLIGAGVVLGALVIKLVAETDYLSFGCYVGILLAAGMAFGAYSMKQTATV